MKQTLSFLTFLLFSAALFAQGNEPEMATALRSSGKIYVVIAVMAIIFLGLIIYLFSLDKRVKKLEKNT